MTKTMKTWRVLLLVFLIAGQSGCGQKSEEEKHENNASENEKVSVLNDKEEEDEEQQVRNAFENYKAAMQNHDGEKAVKFVDSRTIQYYDDMLELIKTADSAKMETLSILDKSLVFTIRHEVPKEGILSFDGKSLFAYEVKNERVRLKNAADYSISEITINENFAKGQLITKRGTPIDFHFYKEGGQWKINLTSMFPILKMGLKMAAAFVGQEENEFLFSSLEMTTGKKPGPEIWEPMVKQDTAK